MTQAEELDLIQRILEGDADAFAPLVDENKRVVFSLAYRMTGSEQDALDLSQEAFLKAYTGLRNFRTDSRFSVWVYRITYNLCIDFIRKNSHLRTVSLSHSDDGGNTHTLDLPSAVGCPQAAAERRSLREAIAAGLHTLSEEHRNVFLMRELAGMSYSEIAAALYINEGTVKSRLSRARRRLAAFLVKSGTLPENLRPTDTEEVAEHE